MFNQPFTIGSLQLNNRLIQGPLAGFSCAPFRALFSQFTPPAYCVSEMLSAHDVLNKHHPSGRYLYRGADETQLCYQISGNDPAVMAEAAIKLEALNADLIDVNCGCPKPKIRKKGAGSALLEQPDRLIAIIKAIRQAINCPLTVKIRIQGNENDITLSQQLMDVGIDALIVHGRRWVDDYDRPCDLQQISRIKRAVSIPVIANGNIADSDTLAKAMEQTGCDGYMISRASTGKPWLFEELLTHSTVYIEPKALIALYMVHLKGLAVLESEHQAVLQGKSLVRYYFRDQVDEAYLQAYYQLSHLGDIEDILNLKMLK